MLPEYTLYKGDDPVMTGTIFEISLKEGLSLDELEFMIDNIDRIEKSIRNKTYEDTYIMQSC